MLAQERDREKALKKLRKLRQKAEAEVERLLAFLDAVDGYTMNEFEEAVDDVPCCDDELEGNLSSLDGRVVPTQFHDPAGDLEQEHDGREPDEGDYEDGGDDEEHEASGIADVDGLMEEDMMLRINTKAHETLGEAIESGKWSWAGL